jgi:hypothetical protein
MVTAASLFPLLIAPQTAGEAPLHLKTSGRSVYYIFLWDMVTTASLFPLLIAPQTAEEAPLHLKTIRKSF